MPALVKLDGKWGCINKKDNTVVDAYYDDLTIFDDGYILAEKDGKYGVLDKDGNVIAGFIYEEIG